MRTTFITGFPGETDEQFEELVDFVRAAAVRAAGRVHLFVRARYAGGQLPDHLSEEVKDARRERLMAVQQEIAFEWNEAQIGQQLDVLIDTPVPDQKNAWIGRSYADAPDVDGVVYVTGEGWRPGQIVPCEIVATSEYDLVGSGGRQTAIIDGNKGTVIIGSWHGRSALTNRTDAP